MRLFHCILKYPAVFAVIIKKRESIGLARAFFTLIFVIYLAARTSIFSIDGGFGEKLAGDFH